MKAIVKIHMGGSATAELRYCLDPNAKKKRALVNRENVLEDGYDIEQLSERVGAVHGYGVNHAALADGRVKSIVSELEAAPSKLNRNGKCTRHVVISVEWDEVLEAAGREDVNNRLIEAAEDWLALFALGCKAVVVRHDDSRCPHVHIIVENYDYHHVSMGHQAKRIDWNPCDVVEMQDFTWTKQFEPGRGSKKNTKAENLSPHAKKLQIFKEKKQAPRDIMYQKIVHKIKTFPTDKRPRNKEDLCDTLQMNLPEGWKMNRYQKNGKERKKPSISNAQGVSVRLDTFWAWKENEQRELRLKKTKDSKHLKTGQCGKCGKSNTHCTCSAGI